MNAIDYVFGASTAPEPIDNRQKAAAIMEATFATKAHPGMKIDPARATPPVMAPEGFANWQQYQQFRASSHRVDPINVGISHIAGVFGF